jgi:uncharacterized protein (TIGR03000 family)
MYARLWFGLSALLILPVPAWAQYTGSNIPRSYDLVGDDPRIVARQITVGPPSYLTSNSYPSTYGRWSYGYGGPRHELYTGLPAPYTSFPETYTPHLPPVASTNGRAYNITATRDEGVSTSDASMAHLSAMSSVIIDIVVPESADVYIQGRAMAETGALRRFVSPRLSPSFAYSYDIQAVWREGGHDMRQTKRLVMRAGEYEKVTFMPTSGTPASPTLSTTGETYFPPVGTAGPSLAPPTGIRSTMPGASR